MAAKRSERPGGDTPPTKRTRDKSADSPARLEEGNLRLLPGNRCPHCDKDCSTESMAIQCDLCHVWVHSQCEGISNELYNKLNEICSGVANVSYYCELNCCNSRIKQLVSDWKLSHSAEPLSTEDSSESLSDKYSSLKQSVNELSSKIDNLLNRNSNLQMEINSVSAPSATNTQASVSSSASISPTLTILDELADRQRRSKNLIFYNFSEASDQLKVQELFLTIFSLEEVQLTRTALLGRRNGPKVRPLLVCFDDALIRGTILSQSSRLRKHEQFKNIYISPDRTKLEREKYQKLVTELKHRSSNGELH